MTVDEFINLPGFSEHCDCFPNLGFRTLKDGTIFKLGHLVPKERTMTYEQATADLAVVEAGVAEAAAGIVDVRHYIVNEDGSRTEVEEAFVTSEGTVADVTVH